MEEDPTRSLSKSQIRRKEKDEKFVKKNSKFTKDQIEAIYGSFVVFMDERSKAILNEIKNDLSANNESSYINFEYFLRLGGIKTNDEVDQTFNVLIESKVENREDEYLYPQDIQRISNELKWNLSEKEIVALFKKLKKPYIDRENFHKIYSKS